MKSSLMATRSKGRTGGSCGLIVMKDQVFLKSLFFPSNRPSGEIATTEIKRLPSCTQNNHQIRDCEKRETEKPKEKPSEGRR